MKGYWNSLILSAVMFVASALLAQAEEGTVKATSAWVGQGQFFQVKEKQALFAGAFEGIMFVERKEGDLDAAKIVCPGMVEVNVDDGMQSGEGRCIIMARSGDRIYARWNCAGEHLRGCAGAFILLGGTGKFKDITGKSDFEVRSNIAEYVVTIPGDRVQATASGVAVWPALTYKLP